MSVALKQSPAEQVQEILANLDRYMMNDGPGHWMEDCIARDLVNILREISTEERESLLAHIDQVSRVRASRCPLPLIFDEFESAISLTKMWLEDPENFDSYFGEVDADMALKSSGLGFDDEDDSDDEFPVVPSFWKPITLEADANHEGMLGAPFNADQVLQAIRLEHADLEKYPVVESVEMDGPLGELGLYRLKIHSKRGSEEIHVWVVPKAPTI